jgi:hypothetical protein
MRALIAAFEASDVDAAALTSMRERNRNAVEKGME